jgi:hypothetical protein
MSYDYDARSVRLDDLTEIAEPGAGYHLCSAHSDRLSPPLGWTLTDHRTVTRLFAPLEVA